jgi:hypothetical protein
MILAPIRREVEKAASSILARGIEDGKGVVGTVGNVEAILWRTFSRMPHHQR